MSPRQWLGIYPANWCILSDAPRQMAAVYGATRGSRRLPAAYVVLVSGIGALALVAGVIAVVAGSAAMLATLAASVGGLWVIATARHTLASGGGSPSRRPAKTA